MPPGLQKQTKAANANNSIKWKGQAEQITFIKIIQDSEGTQYNSAVTKILVQEDVQYNTLDISNIFKI